MAIQDVQAIFDDTVAITVTRNSTNVYDAGVARDLGRGQDIRVVGNVVAAFTAAGAATLAPTFVAADSADLATNPVTLINMGVIGKAALVAGYTFCDQPLPPLNNNLKKRYYGWVYTVATGPMTAGSVNSGFRLDNSGGGVYTAVQPNSY